MTQLPHFSFNEAQIKLAERALRVPGDWQAFEHLSTGYAQQSEKRYPAERLTTI